MNTYLAIACLLAAFNCAMMVQASGEANVKVRNRGGDRIRARVKPSSYESRRRGGGRSGESADDSQCPEPSLSYLPQDVDFNNHCTDNRGTSMFAVLSKRKWGQPATDKNDDFYEQDPNGCLWRRDCPQGARFEASAVWCGCTACQSTSVVANLTVPVGNDAMQPCVFTSVASTYTIRYGDNGNANNFYTEFNTTTNCYTTKECANGQVFKLTVPAGGTATTDICACTSCSSGQSLTYTSAALTANGVGPCVNSAGKVRYGDNTNGGSTGAVYWELDAATSCFTQATCTTTGSLFFGSASCGCAASATA